MLQGITNKLSIFPTPYSDGQARTWRFRVASSVADHVFKYVAAYTDTFRDAAGELPPMPALTDWEPGRYAWATMHPELPAGIQLTLIGDHWELDINVDHNPEDPDPTEWIVVLNILRKISRMEFR